MLESYLPEFTQLMTACYNVYQCRDTASKFLTMAMFVMFCRMMLSSP